MPDSIITSLEKPAGLVQPLGRANTLMWAATYRNNRTVYQYDPKGKHRSFGDLPRENLKRVSFLEIATGKLVASQDFLPGMSPFYRQRNIMVQYHGLSHKVHLIGWAIWDGSPTVDKLHVAFIDERTHAVEMGHFVEGRGAGFKYPIELQDYDYPPITWD